MIANILAGGPSELLPTDFFATMCANQKKQIFIGADYGAVLLVKNGIKLDLAVGDFDTASQAELDMVLKNSHQAVVDPSKDDKTDLEFALEELMARFVFDEVHIYGATGARLDQFLANLFFVLKPQYIQILEKIKIIDCYNEVTFYTAGKHMIHQNESFKYLAFVPLGLVNGLEIIDAKYQLTATDFVMPISLSSNEFVKPTVSFNFTAGIVAVIQSKD